MKRDLKNILIRQDVLVTMDISSYDSCATSPKFTYHIETFEKWLRRGSKSFSLEI
jgi:hypothetical protein